MTGRDRLQRSLVLAAALAFLLAFGVPRASADTFSFNLAMGNTALNPPYTGPYVTVTVNRTDATHATITFVSMTQTIGTNTYLYLMGDGGSVAVNVNAASWVLSALSGDNYFGSTKYNLSDGGARNEDGFGGFNQAITSFDGYGNTSSTISFTLENTGGTWGSADSVLSATAPAAAHIFVCQETGTACTLTGGALVTGFAAGVGSGGSFTNTTVTPEPSSIILLGSAFVGVTGALRKKLQRKNG